MMKKWIKRGIPTHFGNESKLARLVLCDCQIIIRLEVLVGREQIREEGS